MTGKPARPLALSMILRRAALLDMSTFGGKEAQSLAREALALCEKFAPPNSEDLAHAQSTLGYTLTNPREAEALYQHSLAIRTKIDPNGEGVENLLVMLGHNARDLARPSQAVSYYRRAVAIRQKRDGIDHPMSITSNAGLASALAATQQYAEAEAILRHNVE